MTTTGRGLAVTSPKLIFTEDGKRCYAYSGTYESVNDYQTLLLFQSKNSVIKGKFTFNGPVNIANAGAGGPAAYQISFNDVVVALGKADTVTGNVPPAQNQFQEVIIPPLTTVKFIVRCGEDTAAELITATFNGRVYD